MVEELTKDEIKKLRRTVRKFLDDKSKSDKEKVEILFFIGGSCWTILDRYR
ncbi:hypothetical protein [Methanobrevibacter sp. V14]|uniref:hypothetical protein n=1 Tax=Methanobrevibacter sp. V14 TaxID=3064280 RepID=UPI00273352E1|nr:hypothetical protein [Methanobrevibacter sp. V14]